MKNREKLNMEISNFHIYDVETNNITSIDSLVSTM